MAEPSGLWQGAQLTSSQVRVRSLIEPVPCWFHIGDFGTESRSSGSPLRYPISVQYASWFLPPGPEVWLRYLALVPMGCTRSRFLWHCLHWFILGVMKSYSCTFPSSSIHLTGVLAPTTARRASAFSISHRCGTATHPLV